jgi:hypothetical protein
MRAHTAAALGCLLVPALLAGGCADRSYALVSVLASNGSGAFGDVRQLRVEVRNGVYVDTLSYPAMRSTKAYRFDEGQALTFSVGYRSSHKGTVEVRVSPLDANGAPLGYGAGTAMILEEGVTKVEVRVVRGARWPEGADGGAPDGGGVEAGPPCDPTDPASCHGGTCVLSCPMNQPVTGVCTMAGSKKPGELCTGNEECEPGSQCFTFSACGVRTCLRFCKDSSVCGAGACATPLPCDRQPTSFKACSQPCDPVGEAKQGCAAGLNCFLFEGEVPDCDCAGSMHTGGDGAPCDTGDQCKPGFLCVKMSGSKACRPACRLAASPTTCEGGRTCTKLVDPPYQVFGACVP